MTETAQATNGNGNGAHTVEQESLILLDLGSKSRKNVRRLRKGRGKLMRRVTETVEDLQAEGEIAEDAQIVVVVVKQKPRKNNWMRW